MKLRGVILSIEDTLVPNGKLDEAVFAEVTKLIFYLKSKSIDFVVFTNRDWRFNGTPLEPVLKEKWGDFVYLSSLNDTNVPPKPRAEATRYVLEKMGWQANETVYIGASENDMRTAVNGGLLFLRATWYANKTDYGFEFATPKDIAKFIDTFCLREHLWSHSIVDGNFEYYALAPFSTMRAEYTLYSADARAAAKQGLGHPDFWVGALVTSLYFSGIYQGINYIAVYPGHRPGSGNDVMSEAMSIFGKCFRITFLPDLIIRHTQSTQSHTARQRGQEVDHANQLNTIRLNPTPARTATKNYVSSPLKAGKTVLLIDDICTRGFSIEAARAYIEQTGARVILASWLKTINTNISVLAPFATFDPYRPTRFEHAPILKEHQYHANLTDHLAPEELTRQFGAYTNWDWPQ